MEILVPVDGSDCSFRALSFATEMATRYEGAVHVVHFADEETAATAAIFDRARDVVASTDVDAEHELVTDLDREFRPANRVGEGVLELVDERGYDHVVMGHHGSGTVERAIIGSAAETVLRAERVPVTVIP